MKLLKPIFWNKKNIISISIYPISYITKLINFFKKFSSKNSFKIKTICVGNIPLGGTGKTSLAIKINELLKNKFKTVFIKKYYHDQKDEINLLKKNGKVISKSNRLSSLDFAEQKNFEIAILDDGLQQKNINYNLKIACFNTGEGIGNGYLLPAGPLRESLNELINYHIVFLNGYKKNFHLKKKIKSINKKIKIFEATYEPVNLIKLNKKKKYLMFCGIGNPVEFEKTLLKFKFKIVDKNIFPDHYKISNKQIDDLRKKALSHNLSIITTEKDYLRLSEKQKKKINFLKVELKIKKLNEFKKILLNNEKN